MSSTGPAYDVIIIGGGVAGAGLAYFLTQLGVRRVLLLEKEPQLAYHASGRSAQVVLELERDRVVHRLIVAGANFLRHPPPGFSSQQLLRRTGILLGYDEPDWSQIKQHVDAWRQAGTEIEYWNAAQARQRVPVLGEDLGAGVVFLPQDGRISVSALMHGYLNHARAGGAQIRTDAWANGLCVESGRCVGVKLGAVPGSSSIISIA